MPKKGGKINPDREEVISEHFSNAIKNARTIIRQYVEPTAQTSELFRVFAESATNLALAVMSQN